MPSPQVCCQCAHPHVRRIISLLAFVVVLGCSAWVQAQPEQQPEQPTPPGEPAAPINSQAPRSALSAAEAGAGSPRSNRRRRRRSRNADADDKQRDSASSQLDGKHATTTEALSAMPEAATATLVAAEASPRDAAADASTVDAFDAGLEDATPVDVAPPPSPAVVVMPEPVPEPLSSARLQPSPIEIVCTVLFVLATGALGGLIARGRRRR